MKSRLILMLKTKLIRIAVCGLILSLEFNSQAKATPTHVSFSTSSVSYSPGTDSFSMNGVLSGTVTLDTAGPTVNDVGTTTLTAAQCCLGDQLFTAQFTLTLGGVKHDVTQPGHWIASANSDRIEFGLGSPVLYVLTGLGSWDVTLQSLYPSGH